ncbi:hypothetical protein [Streptomyces sp. NPDC101115]|uniref:hypothetical protein n=1 Tax=Streptomyces sp. NPDC101115 TaxID=3366106 RepID=UPI00381B24CF
MGGRLRAYVHIDGQAYGPGDELPAAVARRIGKHAFVDDDEAGAGGDTDGVEAPPRSGRGSGIEAWRAFAEQNGVDTDDEMSRDDVIAAAERAGLVEPEQPRE